MEAAFDRKKDKYSELTAECRGQQANVTAEVGCRGFVESSTLSLSYGHQGGKVEEGHEGAG